MNTVSTCICVLGAMTALACNQAPSRAEDDPPPNVSNEGADFYGLMRRVHYDFQPIWGHAELRAAAEMVVLGRFVGVSDGRTFGGPSGDRKALHTAILKVEVRKTIKGPEKRHVYVEMLRSLPTSIKALEETLPDQDDLVLYLVPASTSGEIHNPRGGLPSGETSYHLVNPQGLAVEVTSSLVHPLLAKELWPLGEWTTR